MLSKTFKGSLLSAGLVAAFAAPTAVAQEEPAINNGKISFDFSVDVATNYFFRGFELEDSGLIVQPGFGASTEVAEGIGVYIGTWQSLHSAQTGAAGIGPDIWYESDFYVGVTLDLIENITFDISYVGYYYPNGNFDEIHELDILVSYDAGSILDGLAFDALIAIEFDDGNGTEDTYGGLTASWGTDLVEGGDYPLSLGVAATLGLGLDDYYVDATGDGEFFGYLQFDVGVSTPLAFIPSDYGSWEAGVTLSAIILNDDVAGIEDTGEDFRVFAIMGVSASY